MFMWIRRRVTTAALTAASAVIMLEFVTPAVFDFIFDLVLLGLIGIVGLVNNNVKD